MAEHLANHDEPPDRDDGWQDLAVANPTFLLERLGSECGDLQFLRELTVNGLDAIAAQPGPASGRVVWDLDWQRLEASAGKVRKLTVTDTGTGMRPDQLGRYINQLASSSREQSHTANFGVGAKVAAGSRNPHGLEYRSWHQGQGSLVCFKRHPDGRWGLEPQRWADGHTDFWRPLDEQDKPWLLRGQDHGTQVVLLGQHERHDTTQAPASVTDTRRHWITRYLNARFLRLPTGVEVLVREHRDRDQPGQLQRVQGEQHHLERHSVAAVSWSWATRSLTGGCSMTIIEPAAGKRRSGARPVTSPPCTATSLRHPAADPGRVRAPSGLRHPLRLRARRAPPSTPGRGQTPAVQHRPHPAAPGPRAAPVGPLGRGVRRLDARRDPPAPGTRRQRRLRPTPGSDPQTHQRDHAALPPQPLPHPPTTIPPITRHRRPRRPADRDAPSQAEAPTTPPPKDADTIITETPRRPTPRMARCDVTTATAMVARTRPVDLPDVAWISARDGTGAPGDLEDQAARYHPTRHELTVNADFRAINDLTTHWHRRYTGVPGAHAVIEAHVREWCEQMLVEVVLAARSSTWSQDQLDALLSPASFTAALLPRHLLHAMLQKRLAQKLGAPRTGTSR